MHRIPVRAASATYDVIVENGALARFADYAREVIGSRRAFVIADEAAWAAQGAKLSLDGLNATVLAVRLGEERKRLAVVEELTERMHRAGADRSAVVIAFGGGVATDVGGFVAASYMRGVDVIQVPTTLLSQVDAAVGGKTGVNLATGKNLVGAFHQPRLVVMDPLTFETLPERELRAGLFEVIKHGIIWDAELFALLRDRRELVLSRDPALLEELVAASVRIKGEVVEKDEREGGLRRILNYGHTLGHALEAETGYSRYLHGECVGWGMIAAGRLGERMGTISAGERSAIEDVLLAYGLPVINGVEPERLVERMAGDKKTIGGKVHFILPETIGRVRVVTSPPAAEALAAAREALEATAPRAAVGSR